jgi:hypothetical protein
MSKKLLLVIAAVAVMASGRSAIADKTTVGFVPDVVVGDHNAPAVQTADGYFVDYGAFDLTTTVFHESSASPGVQDLSGVKIGFKLENPQGDRFITLNGKSQVTTPSLAATGYLANNLTVAKDIKKSNTGGTVDVRLTDDWWTAKGPNIDNANHYGMVDTTALVDLLVTDGSAHFSKTFKVTMAEDGASTLPTQLRNFYQSGALFTDGWVFQSIPLAIPNTTGVNVTSGHDADTVWIDCEFQTGQVGFGTWEKLLFAGTHVATDTLIRARYVVGMTLVPAPVQNHMPVIRSRMRIGPYGTIGDFLLNQECLVDTLGGGGNGNINVVPFVTGQGELRSYFSPTNNSAMLGSTAGVLFSFDEYAYTYNAARLGRANVDHMFVEVLKKEAVQPTSLYDSNDVSGGIANDIAVINPVDNTWTGHWLFFQTGFDKLFNGYTSSNIIGNPVDPTGLRMTEVAAGFNLFGEWQDINSGVQMVPGELIRFIADIKRNNTTSPYRQDELRLRLMPSFYELNNELNIDGRLSSGHVPATYPTASGNEYETYMETPLFYPNIPGMTSYYDSSGHQWAMFIDALAYAGDPTAGADRDDMDVTVTRVRLQVVESAF